MPTANDRYGEISPSVPTDRNQADGSSFADVKSRFTSELEASPGFEPTYSQLIGWLDAVQVGDSTEMADDMRITEPQRTRKQLIRANFKTQPQRNRHLEELVAVFSRA